MSPVARLVWTWFSATPLTRALAAAGAALVTGGIGAQLLVPGAAFGSGELWIQSLLLGLQWLGFLGLLAASALMPAIIEHFVTGTRIWILPRGRLRLLLGALIPGVVLATLTAVAATAAFVSFASVGEAKEIFLRTLLMAFVDIGLIYTAIWLVGKTTGVWRLAGMLWVVACVLIPMRYLGGIPPFSLLEALGLASWVLFAAFVLSAGRLRHVLTALRERAAVLAARFGGERRYSGGREAELLLGLHDAWVVALGQIIPIFAVAWFVPPQLPIWVAFLVIFSAISGAIASQGARRSRAMWLRYPLDRAQIASCVERVYWRYNAKSLAVLLLVFIGLSAWYGFPAAVVVLGCLLLLIGCAVSTWLGLTITSGLGWSEAIHCVVTISLLMAASLALIGFNLIVTAALAALLIVLAAYYRRAAAARWSRLDWMRAR